MSAEAGSKFFLRLVSGICNEKVFLHGQDFPFLETKQFVVLQTESQQLLDLLIR